MFSLETERLVIREMTQNDFDAYFRICHQPEVHPYVPHISDNRDIEYGRFVSYIQMVYGFYGFGLWGIFLKEQDILIGQAGIESCPIFWATTSAPWVTHRKLAGKFWNMHGRSWNSTVLSLSLLRIICLPSA